MPSYFWVSKIDINILSEFVLPAEKVGGWVGAENTKTFRFVKTIGNPGLNCGRDLDLLHFFSGAMYTTFVCLVPVQDRYSHVSVLQYM